MLKQDYRIFLLNLNKIDIKCQHRVFGNGAGSTSAVGQV